MSQSDDNKARKQNIIDMQDARRRQKELAKQRKREARASQKMGWNPGSQKFGVWTIVQAVILLGMVYWLMQHCQGRAGF